MNKSVSRRSFIKGGLAGTVAVTVLKNKETQASGDFEGYPDSMGVIVDVTRCVGCRSCEAACNKEQKLPEPAEPFDDFSVFDQRHYGQRRRTDEAHFTVVNKFEIPELDHPLFKKFQCNHCNEPACLTSCFVEALTFGKRTDMLEVAHQRIRMEPGKYIDHVYGEHEAGGTSWMYLSPVPFDQVGLDTDVPKEPILNYVKGFLAIVPMVLTIWPALFAGFHLLSTRKDRNKELHKDENQEG